MENNRPPQALPSDFPFPEAPHVRQAANAALERYILELQRGNARFGLISHEDAADPECLRVRHILDSLSVAPIVAELAAEVGSSALFDLGSGAGLPGIPLALVIIPGISEVVLVERRQKRVNFLRGLIPQLTATFRSAREAAVEVGVPPEAPPVLPRIRVVEADADDLPAGPVGTAETRPIVVFRAYQQTSLTLLQSLSRNFPAGTPVCALKGRMGQTTMEQELIERSGLTAGAVELHRLQNTTEGAERSALVWRTR